MFTGLVEKKGIVVSNKSTANGKQLAIAADFCDLESGESIAINGVCLTRLPVTDSLLFDVSPETLAITSLGELEPGDFVNLERAMVVGARLGGHYVTGHVDCTACISSLNQVDDFLEVSIGGFEKTDFKYLIPKGSITIDGVSLTINSVRNDCIGLMLVPHTLDNTTLKELTVGRKVNVEFDYLARIVAHQLQNASLI